MRALGHLGSPTSRSKRCSPARPLQSRLWLRTSTPFRWFSPALELSHPYPAPSPFKGAGNWIVDGTGALLREKWDKFGEISSLSGNSSLIYWGFPSKDALLLHLTPPPPAPPFPLCLSSTLKSLGGKHGLLLVSVPLNTSARYQRKGGSSEARGDSVCCAGRKSLWERGKLPGLVLPLETYPHPPSCRHSACVLSKRQGDKVKGTLYKWHPDPPFQPCPGHSLWKP